MAEKSAVELTLAKIERGAHSALAVIDQSGHPPPQGTEDRERLALFLGVQVTRTTGHREQVLFPKRIEDWLGGRTLSRELMAEYLEHQHLSHPPNKREVEGAFLFVSEHLKDTSALTPDFVMEMMLGSAALIAERLLDLIWAIETDRRRGFITSDVPVIPWRKPSVRDRFEGLGVANAEEVRFPLDPGKQLVLSRRNRPQRIAVEVHRVRRSNTDIAGACHRFIVGSPMSRKQIEAQRLHFLAPVVRFNVGPMFVEGPDGKAIAQEGKSCTCGSRDQPISDREATRARGSDVSPINPRAHRRGPSRCHP